METEIDETEERPKKMRIVTCYVIVTTKVYNLSEYLRNGSLLIRIPPPPGGTAILPEYIHYYGYYYQVIVQCLST
jgi:hypothetical protein